MQARTRIIAYWTATAVVAFCFLSGGAANLLHIDESLKGMLALGYPAYFLTILGMWKLLGGVAIVAPGIPRIKEWAYAGVAFDLSGAAFSHAAMGHPTIKVLMPLMILAIAFASWALRPAGRTLQPVEVRDRECIA